MVGIQISGILYQGADFTVSEVFQNADATAFDWSGYTFAGTIVTADGTTTVASFDPSSFVVDAGTGRLTATVLGSDLDGVVDGEKYSFDIKAVNGPFTAIPFYGRKSLTGVGKVTA